LAFKLGIKTKKTKLIQLIITNKANKYLLFTKALRTCNVRVTLRQQQVELWSRAVGGKLDV